MSETALIANETIVESPPARAKRARTPSGAMAAPMRFAKDTTQGACAGLLTLAGATQFASANAAPSLIDAFSEGGGLDSIGTGLVAGDFTGLLQIAGAAALFLTAGRGLARVFGLLVFVAAATAYFNGVAPADIIERSRDILAALGPAYETFQNTLMMSS